MTVDGSCIKGQVFGSSLHKPLDKGAKEELVAVV